MISISFDFKSYDLVASVGVYHLDVDNFSCRRLERQAIENFGLKTNQVNQNFVWLYSCQLSVKPRQAVDQIAQLPNKKSGCTVSVLSICTLVTKDFSY